MTDLFLLPGLGADARVYRHIILPQDFRTKPVRWLAHVNGDSLESYASRLVSHYAIGAGSVVIGNSLGGMLAIEIAKQVQLQATILISSIKTAAEAPRGYRWYRIFPLYKLLPAFLLNGTGRLVKRTMGPLSKPDEELFVAMLNDSSPEFIRWALGAILYWENYVIPKNVYHIHGDRDQVFPADRIRNATLVRGGGHLMVLNRAEEISEWLQGVLLR